MLHKVVFFLVILTLMVGISNSNMSPSAAQDSIPLVAANQPQQDSDGNWYMPPSHPESDTISITSPQTTGGPDEFGYIWDNTIPFSWIDATTGTDAGLGGYSCGEAVGPIQLPFSFSHYENTYSELWINAGGYLTFSNSSAYACAPNSMQFPEPGSPVNLIVPMWSRYNLAEDGSTNRVYYKSGGTAPNRYFVVEWYQVVYAYLTHPVNTYEVILYENGNIEFQYHTIGAGGYYCADIAMGIENANGYDGLTYLDYCRVPASSTAVRFTRPADSARIQILNPYHGTFTQPHQLISYELLIVNTGTLGPDTYNLTTTSTWDLTFKNSSGIPLTDTNADGIVDTGQLAQGETFTLMVDVQTPTIINPTDQNNMTATITSVMDASRSKFATLQAAVPVPFVQSFDESGMGVYLVKPDGQQDSMITNNWGYEMAIDETPDQGFAYAWYTQRYLDDTYTISVSEIEYTVLNNTGNPIRDITKLTDNSGATIDTYDDSPTVAVAPNGRIGILWDECLINETGQRNYNIFLAILTPTGDLSFGPINITNNNIWGSSSDLNIPQISSSRISATEDNRFVLSWYQGYEASDGDMVSNIAYTIRDSNGDVIKPPTILTDDIPGASRQYSNPSVGQLNNHQVLVAFTRVEDGVYDLYYFVLNSDGGIIKSMTNLSNDGTSSVEFGADIAQFSTGNIAVAWNTRVDVRVTVLDTSFNRIADPISVSHPAMRFSSWMLYTYLSLAPDTNGHVALTWSDPDWNNSRHLYYALFNSDGSIQTPPMIFRASGDRIVTGAQGYSSASYTFNPTTSGVDTTIQAPPINYVPLEGTISIPIQFANNGGSLATSVTITAALSEGLTYLGDNSGVLPTTNSSMSIFAPPVTQYTWTFTTDMDFLGSGQFDIYIGIEDGEIGTSLPITITISSAELDEITNNNIVILNVVPTQVLLLPLIVR